MILVCRILLKINILSNSFIGAFDARKEANNRRQLLQAYIRCAANAAQSHQHDKVKEYTQKVILFIFIL